MLKNQLYMKLLATSVLGLISIPSLALPFHCDDFLKQYQTIVWGSNHGKIHKKFHYAISEMVELGEIKSEEFRNNTFAYAELINKFGYVEKKYYAYSFDKIKDIKNENNKIYLKTTNGRDPTETILRQIGNENLPKEKKFKLRIYNVSLNVNAEKYNPIILGIESKLDYIRFYKISDSALDDHFESPFFPNKDPNTKIIFDEKKQFLSADFKNVEYVILSDENTLPTLEENFPSKDQAGKYKIVQLEDALKEFKNYEYVYYILPPFFAVNNEWLYEEKQTKFEISEKLDENGKSFVPKKYFVSKGNINRTNIVKSNAPQDLEEFNETSSINVRLSNTKNFKTSEFLLVFSNPNFFFDFYEVKKDTDKEKVSMFDKVFKEIKQEMNTTDNHKYSYAEYYKPEKKEIEKKYYALDNLNFTAKKRDINTDFVFFDAKKRIIPEIKVNAADKNKVDNNFYFMADAEQRILEKFLGNTADSNLLTEGTLKIYTTYPKCDNCRAFYTFFKKLRPRVNLEIISHENN